MLEMLRKGEKIYMYSRMYFNFIMSNYCAKCINVTMRALATAVQCVGLFLPIESLLNFSNVSPLASELAIMRE